MTSFKGTLEKRKAESTLQVLFKVSRLLNEQALATLNKGRATNKRYRPSHMAIYPHLSLEGTRITTLAARMEISKQAVGQVVEELEQMGLVRRVPDPSDGRAKLVKFTAAGREGMLRGLGLLETIEQELAIALGEKQIQNMGRTLRKVLSHLEG